MSAVGERIAAEVNRLAAESPDFIYPHEDCTYVLDGEPSCLYGQALWNLGLIDASFERKIGRTPGGRTDLLNYQSIDTVLSQLGLKVDSDEVRGFLDSQDVQDNHRPWSVAAKRMNDRLAKLS